LYWKAGTVAEGDGEVYPTGGHIHFGIHSAVPRRVFGDRDVYYKKMTRYLDTYLAQVVRQLENPHELGARLDGEYGFLGDHRANEHGFEYRVLGSWLTSPRVAEGVLCLAQTIAYQHMLLTSKGKCPEENQLTPNSELDDYNSGSWDRGAINVPRALKVYRTKFKELQTDIRKFKLYRRHELPIEFIFKLVETKKSWYPGEEVDMKAAWGLVNAKGVILEPSKKILPAVKFDDIWKRARG